MNSFNSLERPSLIQKIASTTYDLAIIGGGITGAGIALDAASRGLKTILIEKNDFASGTSSKSTKLIHGGLRYLKQFEVALVREVGRERAIVHALSPHLVRSEKMLLPLIKDGTFGSILTSFGLMVYDVLAGVEKADQRKMYEKDKILEKEPLIREDILEGGGIYAEYRTDDARLTIEVLKTANSYGADIISYAEAVDFVYQNEKVSGVHWKDNLDNGEHVINAKTIVSAAGPWVDQLRAKNQSLKGKHLHPTKGVHIVVPHERFPVKQSVYFDIPDGRMIFAIPRDRVTYIGTTDTDYNGDLNDVRATADDVHYLVDGVNHIFPKVALKVSDVESTWVGLRPLIQEEGKSAGELSRKDEIFESETGLISIAGGKLTGYRKMAERLVDKISEQFQKEGFDIQPCKTEQIVLCGGPFAGRKAVRDYTKEIAAILSKDGLEEMADYLVSNYGRQTDVILDDYKSQKERDPQVRLGLCELRFTLEKEATFSLLDFFERRTGRLYFNINSIKKLKDPIKNYMAEYFKWSEKRIRNELEWLDAAISKASDFQ